MIKRVLKIFVLLIILALIAIQFIPVDRTNPPVDKNLDFLETAMFSADNKALVKSACYDCHSNETVYPWYSSVAPFSFVIENHIKEGREELNFSEFQTYSDKKKDHKLEEVVDALKNEWMPLDGYVVFHGDAKLSKEQRLALALEFERIRQELNFD